MLNRPHPKEIHEWLSPPLLGWSRLCITGQLQHPTLIHVLPWFTLKIQDGIEIVGLGCRWGLSWFLALLQTQSAGHVSSLPMSSKYWELINCMATAQVIFIIIVCLTIFKVPMTKWLLFILALKQWEIFFDHNAWKILTLVVKMCFFNNCFSCYGISHFFCPPSHCYSF